MLKTRYLINLYNLQQSIMSRPTLTYFLVKDREPLGSFTVAYGPYFPLNFGTTTLYGRDGYIETLLHLSPSFMLELSGTLKTVTWSPSQELLSSGEPMPEGTFPMHSTAFVLGVGLMWSYSL